MPKVNGKYRVPKKPKRDEDVHKILHLFRDKKHSEVARMTGLSPTTIRNWRLGPKLGGTRYPQHISMQMAAKALGGSYQLIIED